jgi:uncharacterized protein
MTRKTISKKALWDAAKSGDTSNLPGGFKNIVDPNMCNNDGMTLLMTAAINGHLKIVKQLVSVGCDINKRNQDSHTALLLACFFGHLAVVKFLITHGADVNLRYAIESGNGIIKNQTALILSAHQGHFAICKVLVESGADIEAISDAGYTPLMASMVNGASKSIAKYLLTQGANPSPDVKSQSIQSRSTTPLILAAMNGWSDLVQQLIDIKVNVDATDGLDMMTQTGKCTALKYAVQNNHLMIVKKLLIAGASVDTPDFEGWTPLMTAAVEGFVEIVKILLKYGANPDIKQKSNDSSFNGETALIKAARNGHEEIVEILLEAGANVNVDTLNGVSAFSAAIDAYRRSDNYQVLGGIISALGLEDSMAVPFGSDLSKRSLNVIDTLLKHGADINISLNGDRLTDLLEKRNDLELNKLFKKHGVPLYSNMELSDKKMEFKNSHDGIKITRSRTIQAQITEANALKLSLLNNLYEIGSEFGLERTEKINNLIKLIENSNESFDCELEREEYSLNSDNRRNMSNFEQRSSNLIGGPFFTSINYPQDRGWLPVIQVDLRDISKLIGKSIGDGLLQLWYMQGRDLVDSLREKIVTIPREEVREELLTEWHHQYFDEAEVTKIEPLNAEWCGFYWWASWIKIVGFVSKGVQCQHELVNELTESLSDILPSELIENIYRFTSKCNFEFPGGDPVAISFFGTFEPLTYSHADINKMCLVAFHIWGPRDDGGAQLFLNSETDANNQFLFKENWFGDDEGVEIDELLKLRKKKKYMQEKERDHQYFLSH